MIKSQKVDEYVNKLNDVQKQVARALREVIDKNAPEANEDMRYGVPGYNLNGPLVYFGLFEKHVGLYPTPSGVKNFENEITQYKHAKGSIQFGLDEVPLELIAKIVQFRVEENKAKARK